MKLLLKPALLLAIISFYAISAYPQVKLNSFFDPLLSVPEGIEVLQTSSHNKTGDNGDAGWAQYTDANGDQVIFDAAGPGCIKQMWGTSFDPEAILKFYFDGSQVPLYQCNILDFYKGRESLYPDMASLVSYDRRGNWGDNPYAGNSFQPISFGKHLKISVKGSSNFYHILYEKYSGAAASRGISPPAKAPDPRPMKYLMQNFRNLNADYQGMEKYISDPSPQLNPGTSLVLFRDSTGGGIIRELTIEGDGSEDFFRDVYIRMRWDSAAQYQVMAPIGIFFGSANRADTMRSLPLEVTPLSGGRAKLVCRFPMPYYRSAEINLLNKSKKTFNPVSISMIERRADAAKRRGPGSSGTWFTTQYHAGETVYGRDWTLYEGKGSGWYVGTVQSMMQEHYCEGNEHFYIDGAVSPQINGTGSEDYYLACFWPNNDFDTPFGCVAGDIQKEGGGTFAGSYEVPSSYSRFHLEAPVPFYSGLSAKIQHGGTSNIISKYRSLAYVYINPASRLNQTDYIDVGNGAGELAHQYKSTQSQMVTIQDIRPEGEYLAAGFQENGRYHTGGTITFTVAIDPANNGVRLRRLLDQKTGPQKAEVFIDGKPAGTWYWGCQNEFLRAYEQDFDIGPALTAGKGSLSVRLEVEGRFSDLGYGVYCVTGGKE